MISSESVINESVTRREASRVEFSRVAHEITEDLTIGLNSSIRDGTRELSVKRPIHRGASVKSQKDQIFPLARLVFIYLFIYPEIPRPLAEKV